MFNLLFELDALRTSLLNKGLSEDAVSSIISNAKEEINSAIITQGESAMNSAIEAGVQKRSPEFINELRMDLIDMQLTTESGNFDFSEPPYPMLNVLLQNAKPIKDGSGVYKVIPVGAPSKNRQPVYTNIYDAHKRMSAERLEAARAQYERIAPKGSKTNFRTATSKQDASAQWVRPAQEKNFAGEMDSINSQLKESIQDTIINILRSYEEGF